MWRRREHNCMLLVQLSQYHVILRLADPRKCIEFNKMDYMKNSAYLKCVKDGQCSGPRGTFSSLSFLTEKIRHDIRSQSCVSHPNF
jgi:hypothetical protein